MPTPLILLTQCQYSIYLICLSLYRVFFLCSNAIFFVRKLTFCVNLRFIKKISASAHDLHSKKTSQTAVKFQDNVDFHKFFPKHADRSICVWRTLSFWISTIWFPLKGMYRPHSIHNEIIWFAVLFTRTKLFNWISFMVGCMCQSH